MHDRREGMPDGRAKPKAFVESRLHMWVACIIGFLRMPLLFNTLTGHALRFGYTYRVHTRLLTFTDILPDVIF